MSHVSKLCAFNGTKFNPPEGKDVRLFGKGQLIFGCLRRELADDLGCKMAEPAARDPQLILSPTAERKKHRQAKTI